MSSFEAELEKLVKRCNELPVSWDWDGRFSAAVAVVEDPDHHALLERVEAVLPHHWDHQTIGDASAAVRAIADLTGGLRAGQRLFMLDPEGDPVLFAAWWPWGSGMVFSLRIACASRDPEVAEQNEAFLRKLFSI
jgi:hypothetical protein